MTREEAIKAFEGIKASAQSNLGAKHAVGCDGYYRDRIELAEAALNALRPISREQVEKAWKGEPVERCDPYHLLLWTACPRCGYEFMDECPEDFCPKCGAAFTDEAVDMVMDRLNELTSEEEN